MENVKQHAWIYGSSQQLSNNITCYRKERKQNILPRSFRCVIFFALFILLCCCSNLLWLLLLLSMVRLWQRNVHRLYHIILFFLKRETKCKICEYLHNWMIWYSIRQFECLSSLWCVRVERPTSSKDRFVYISSLSHSMLLHLFKEIFRTTYTSVTRERERGSAGEDENKWFVWQNASRETELKYTDPESFDRSEKTYVISDF